jgi:hypothetical protein
MMEEKRALSQGKTGWPNPRHPELFRPLQAQVFADVIIPLLLE